MKKTAALIVCIVLSVAMSVNVFAGGSMDNFQKERIYNNTFTDIDNNDWFYNSVAEAFEYGIADGLSESEFSPYEPVSLAQAIAFGAKLNMTYTNSSEELAEGENWYDPYVSYAREHGIIEDGVFESGLEFPATRAQVAYILARSISFAELKNINTGISALPDVSSSDKFYNEILLLYRAGVITGKDEYGNFCPNEYITRCEVCAMLGRIINSDLRVKSDFKQLIESSGDKIYNAVEISEKASSAVFYIEIYDKKNAAYASGSGFFISSDGICVTNYHVIEDGYSAKIKLTDGTVYDVESVIGYDKNRDIAILKVNGSGFNYLELGNSDEIAAGEDVFCIGSPLGLDNTLSTGVVSNTNRVEDDLSYIQITAPISNGSSGGAVLDNKCKLIGISCGGYTYGQNLNLAIPSNAIQTVAQDKNITLYELTTGIKPGESDQTGGLETSLGELVGYTDNQSVPDFGKLNNINESKEAQYSGEIVKRYYESDVEGVSRYLSQLRNLGFYRLRQVQLNGMLSMIYSNTRSAVLVEYNMYTGETAVAYYYNK